MIWLPTWTLTHRDRPWLMNDANAGGARGVGGIYGRAELTRTWRAVYGSLCQQQKIPPLEWATIVVSQHCTNRRLPDIGACMPAVKAAIDGLVDADVLPDDTGRWIHLLSFQPPQAVGYDALVLQVTGPAAPPDECRRREHEVRAKMVRRVQRQTRRRTGMI